VSFAHAVPAGPGIAGLAVAPPIRVTAEHVAALPDLRIVAAAAAGHDHIDVTAVMAAGACVTNAPGYCDVEVADHAIAMAGALLRRLHAADAMVRGGVWSSRAVGARRITGSTIGIVGLGRIGTLTAQRAAALGMRVLAWAPRTPSAQVRALGAVPCQTLAALLAASDVVSLHLPLTPETKGIIDAGALTTMRSGSYLVNCGRGELVDLHALRDALESGHLAGAALDVLDTEPPSAGHLVFDLPNTIITPHMAWLSPQSEFASYEMAARAIADVLAGRPPRHLVQR
jgi:D-3-phosphoglycerate dehydrogenase